MNLFELYNLPLSFLPNKDEVKKQYFALSRKYHPDFYGNGTDEEKAEALEMSALVNKAYKIFNNIDSTIYYVLELEQLIEPEEKFELTNDFLMEMMDLNEKLMDAKMEDDSNALQTLCSIINTLEHNLYTDVAPIIENKFIINLSKENFLQVKEYYFKKKYLNRILESIKS